MHFHLADLDTASCGVKAANYNINFVKSSIDTDILNRYANMRRREFLESDDWSKVYNLKTQFAGKSAPPL